MLGCSEGTCSITCLVKSIDIAVRPISDSCVSVVRLRSVLIMVGYRSMDLTECVSNMVSGF